MWLRGQKRRRHFQPCSSNSLFGILSISKSRQRNVTEGGYLRFLSGQFQKSVKQRLATRFQAGIFFPKKQSFDCQVIVQSCDKDFMQVFSAPKVLYFESRCKEEELFGSMFVIRKVQLGNFFTKLQSWSNFHRTSAARLFSKIWSYGVISTETLRPKGLGGQS